MDLVWGVWGPVLCFWSLWAFFGVRGSSGVGTVVQKV